MELPFDPFFLIYDGQVMVGGVVSCLRWRRGRLVAVRRRPAANTLRGGGGARQRGLGRPAAGDDLAVVAAPKNERGNCGNVQEQGELELHYIT